MFPFRDRRPSHAAGFVFMARWLLCLCSAWLLLAGAPAAAQVLDIKQALSAEGDSARFPIATTPKLVTLPDDWAESRPRHAGPVWYRVAFDAPGVSEGGELLALYIERVCSSAEIYLNGQLLHQSGSMTEPIARNCQYPQLVALPAALLRPQGNLLDLKLAGHPLQRVASRQRAAGLSALQLGPHALLAQRHARAYALGVTLPQVVSGTLALLGGLMFVLGYFDRRQSHLAYFGALAAGWAAVTARLWWREVPLPNYDAELLLTSFLPFVALAAVQFLVRYAGWRSRPIDVALYAQCLIVPLSMLLAGPNRVYSMASAWYAVLGIETLGAIGLYLGSTRRRPLRQWLALALLLVGMGTLVGLEFAAQQSALDKHWLTLTHLAMPVIFVAVGARLMLEYGRALQTAEAGRQTLESRVRDATAEIEKNFAQLAELRVEQVTERERKRIAADLHDDLGAKLLTIVHTSESDRISSLAREALEEMRLSVRGLTGKPVRLIDALGDWRAEVVLRLGQAGVHGEWSSPPDDMPQTLSARSYVQTTRILREAVSNVIKHSGASQCDVRCTLAEGDFQFVIQDNGKGIPLELDGRLDRGHGMSSMKHRAKQLQGQCLVESGPGYGTVIRLTLPLDQHAGKP
jgi:signal transduction histidine kinase